MSNLTSNILQVSHIVGFGINPHVFNNVAIKTTEISFLNELSIILDSKAGFLKTLLFEN